MTTYTVHFRNSTSWACHDLKADTPEKALALAQKHVEGDSEKCPIHIGNWCSHELPRVSTLRHSRHD
jgi:hypothetical protein